MAVFRRVPNAIVTQAKSTLITREYDAPSQFYERVHNLVLGIANNALFSC